MARTTPKAADAHLIALQLIAQHGLKAPTIAAAKADEMLQAGNIYERHTWRRVQQEIEAVLERGGPEDCRRDLLGDFPGHGLRMAFPMPGAAPRTLH